MNNKNNHQSLCASLLLAIALCAGWLMISAGCGQGPPVSRPNKPLPKTSEFNSTPAKLER